MNVIIIGMGEIGTAIEKLIKENIDCFITHLDKDPNKSDWSIIECFDIMHVCFPEHNCSQFVSSLTEYIKKIKSKLVVIHSTISIDTVEKLSLLKTVPIYHLPIRGTHGRIEKDMKKFPLYIGSVNQIDKKDVLKYLEKVFKIPIYQMDSAKETALSKLLSVVWYGMNICFVQGVKLMCERNNINFDQAYTEFFASDVIGDKYYFNEKLKKIVANKLVPKPVFYPGYIAGKCVIQDVELLQNELQELSKFILESNERFKNKS